MRSRLSSFVLSVAALLAAVLLGFAAHGDGSARPALATPLVIAPVPTLPSTHLLLTR